MEGPPALSLSLVDVVHLLLQHHRLLRQVLQALPRLICLVVLLTKWGLVDGERLLLVGQRRPEVPHAALGAGHQMVASSNLQDSGFVVGDCESKCLLEEPKADIILPNSVQDKPNVGVNQSKVGMVLSSHQRSQVPSSVEQLEGRGDLGVCEAVEGNVGVFCDRVWMVDAIHALGQEDGLLLAAHRQVKEDVTDDATMVELTGKKVKLFMGSPSNIKITHEADLIIAKEFLKGRSLL